MSARPTVVLRRPSRTNPRFGHPWIYRSQILDLSGHPSPGGLVRAVSEKGHAVGVGYYNPASEIAVRLLAREDVPVDEAFFRSRFRRAEAFRRRFVTDSNAWRAVSSEADGLPGLVIDRYDETLVVQFLTLGMENLRPLVLEAIAAELPSRGLYERSDAPTRRFEGLEPRTGWIRRDCGDSVVVREGDIRYKVRFEAGHKTGLYLDQRENRLALAALGPPKGEALDVFCYEGGFGLHLARAGMRVSAIDQQEEALAAAAENRSLSGIPEGSLRFKAANAFDEMKDLERSGARFDVVVLDPPSFVRHKSAVESALTGYKELLLRAMRLLNDGGWLAVFSCSFHVDDVLLMRTCLDAAHDVRRSMRVLKFLRQSADHPIDPFIPETYYLKGFLLEMRPL